MSSLMDAFLLEPTPLKTPTEREIYVALRTDGVLGSGTAADPYDGSTIRLPAIPASIAWPGEVQSGVFVGQTRITVTTTAPHGFADHDIVKISGVTGTGQKYFNGEFVITRISDTQFKVRILTPPAAPSGSPVCGKVVYRLDDVLRNQGANTTVRLGGGTFETRGNSSGYFDETEIVREAGSTRTTKNSLVPVRL